MSAGNPNRAGFGMQTLVEGGTQGEHATARALARLENDDGMSRPARPAPTTTVGSVEPPDCRTNAAGVAATIESPRNVRRLTGMAIL